MTLPANVSANVGQVGGQPATPADLNNYFSQLGSSLNNFAGNVSNVVNYLLASGVFTPKTVRTGQLGVAFTPVRNPVSGGSLCGLAAGGTGSVFTPAATGRVIVLGMLIGNMNIPVANSGSQIGGTMYYGLGETGPDNNTTYTSNAGPTGTKQIGQGVAVVMTDSGNSGSNYALSTISLSVITGLNKSQSYWIDWGVAAFANNVGSGTPFLEAPGTSIIVVEY